MRKKNSFTSPAKFGGTIHGPPEEGLDDEAVFAIHKAKKTETLYGMR